MLGLLQIWMFKLLLAFSSEGHVAMPAIKAVQSADSSVLRQDKELLERIALDYPFIGTQIDTLGGAANLQPLWNKLAELERGERRKVHIVQIGDSHIQADFFSARVRQLLQDKFGTAGRGLIFPYRLARTNGPNDYSCTSDAAWESRKSIYAPAGPPMGICGMGLRTSSPSFLVNFQLKRQDQPFNQVTMFFGEATREESIIPGILKPGAKTITVAPAGGVRRYHKVKSGETLSHIARRYGCSVKNLQRWNGLRSTRINIGQRLIVSNGGAPQQVFPKDAFSAIPYSWDSSYAHPQAGIMRFDTLLTGLSLQTASKTPTELYGWLLEDTRSSGIIYSSIGVNGATYGHFNRSEYFARQLPVLAPDLIIISLGTNEALGGKFNAGDIRNEAEKLIASVRAAAPDAVILISSNPDVLRRRRYINPNNEAVKNILKELSVQHQLAWWDLHAIMGGQGAVKRWRSAQLAQSDYVHFTTRGYQVQGELLFAALMGAYHGND